MLQVARREDGSIVLVFKNQYMEVSADDISMSAPTTPVQTVPAISTPSAGPFVVSTGTQDNIDPHVLSDVESSISVDSGSGGTAWIPPKLVTFLEYVYQVKTRDSRFTPVYEFLRNEATSSDCFSDCFDCNLFGTSIWSVSATGQTQCVVATGHGHRPVNLLLAKIKPTLSPQNSSRTIWICENVRPLGGVYLATDLHVDVEALLYYVNRDTMFESRHAQARVFDYPEMYVLNGSYASHEHNRFFKPVNAAKVNLVRLWRNVYASFHRLVWVTVPRGNDGSYTHLLLIDALEKAANVRLQHVAQRGVSFTEFCLAMHTLPSRDRSVKEELESMIQSTLFQSKGIAASSSSRNNDSEIGHIISDLIGRRWTNMLNRVQEKISQDKAPLSAPLQDVSDVLQRKHDFEKVQRVASTMRSAIQSIPQVGDDVLIIKKFQHIEDRLVSWTTQLEKVSQSLLGMLAVSESLEATRQAVRSKNLQLLAFVFIPISTVSSVYGMNTREIQDDAPSNWYFIVGSVVAISASVALAYIYQMFFATAASQQHVQQPSSSTELYSEPSSLTVATSFVVRKATKGKYGKARQTKCCVM